MEDEAPNEGNGIQDGGKEGESGAALPPTTMKQQDVTVTKFPFETVGGLLSLGTRLYLPILVEKLSKRKEGEPVVIYGTCLEVYCTLHGSLFFFAFELRKYSL